MEHCPCSFKGAENGKELRRQSCTNSGVWRISTKFKATKWHGQYEDILKIPDSLSYFGLKSGLWRVTWSSFAAPRHFLKQLLNSPLAPFFWQGLIPWEDWDSQAILTVCDGFQSLLGYYWKSRLLSPLQDLLCKTPVSFSAEYTNSGLSLLFCYMKVAVSTMGRWNCLDVGLLFQQQKGLQGV